MVTWSSEAAGVHAIEDFPDRGRILGNRAQGRIQERVLSGRDVRHGGCLGSAQPPRLEPDTRAWTATQITPLPRLSERYACTCQPGRIVHVSRCSGGLRREAVLNRTERDRKS